MNTLLIMLGFQLVVGLPEIIICILGALILGFTIHFFWNSRKSMKVDEPVIQDGISENDNWKLKYFNDMDMQEKAQQQLRERLAEARENEQILTIEIEELQKELISPSRKTSSQEPVTEAPVHVSSVSSDDYLMQLKSAQENLTEHNQYINRLLEQVQQVKESERKYAELARANEQLSDQIIELRKSVSEKENEIAQNKHHQWISEEMATRLDKAYSEFNLLQEKLQKLEGFLSQPYNKGIEYDELHTLYFRLTKDFDEVKGKQLALWEENQRLTRILSDTEDKLREANFQRQQLQKKANFLEELNKDLQEVSEHSKKLENQLRRISEMETLIARAASGRNELRNE